ncbi:helix-turn-helix domain-containing protein [Paenibacillus montanisoli]|nr:helix-turn-helix domain-containing protein [Paenibacillus montanisoli]
MRFFQTRLLWKYFASYFCFLMIPLLGLGFFVFNYFTQYVQNDVIENNLNTLTQVRNIVDNQFQEIKDISYQISRDPDLTPYKIKNNENRGLNIKQNLETYKSTNFFVHELYLYMRGDKFIYSPISTYTPERLLNYKYKYKSWTLAEFTQALNSSESPILRPAEDVELYKLNTVEKFITYIVPIPLYDSMPYGTVMFQVKDQMLKELVQGMMKNYDGNSIIMDAKGQIVSSFKDADYLHALEFANLMKAQNGTFSEKMTMDDTEYLISSIKSDRSHWSYISVIPTKSIMAEVSSLKWKTMLGLAIMLLFGSAIIYYISFKQYNPIKRLKEFAEEKWGEKLGSAGNEIEAVRLVVDYLSDNNQTLFSQVQSSKTALKDQYLFKLLKGQIYNIQELNEHGKEVQLSFTRPYFSVVIMGTHSLNQSSKFSKEAFISYIESHLPEGTEGYVKESMDDGSVVLILASDYRESNELKLRMEELSQSIRQHHEIQVTVGIGSQYEEPHLIGKSYMESITAYNYRMILGNNIVIGFDDISGKVNDLDEYPKKDIERLSLALKQDDIDMVSEVIGSIIQYIKASNASIFVARCLCYDVINTILKSLFEMYSNNAFHREKYPDVIALLKFETVEELELQVRRVWQDILQGMKENSDRNSADLKTRIIAYIQKHCCNPDFSVQLLAEHIGVSSSYISRYFKEQTGQSISDHVNHLRIKQAESFLLASEESLQNIVHKVGYYDVSSFIRKFKSLSGVTPGEFRKLNKRS